MKVIIRNQVCACRRPARTWFKNHIIKEKINSLSKLTAYYGEKMIAPEKLQNKVLEELHTAHPGVGLSRQVIETNHLTFVELAKPTLASSTFRIPF